MMMIWKMVTDAKYAESFRSKYLKGDEQIRGSPFCDIHPIYPNLSSIFSWFTILSTALLLFVLQQTPPILTMSPTLTLPYPKQLSSTCTFYVIFLDPLLDKLRNFKNIKIYQYINYLPRKHTDVYYINHQSSGVNAFMLLFLFV